MQHFILKHAFGIAITALLCACQTASSDQQKEIAALRRELDSLKQSKVTPAKDASPLALDTLNSQVSPEVVQVKTNAPTQTKTEVTKVSPLPKETQEPSVPVMAKEEQEVIYYYTSSKKVSLRITPWVDGRRQLIFYDPFGNIQYTQEDVRLSYSEVSEVVEFHSNGAVAKIHIHNNPGASMYWSESDVTFGINNDPEWMIIHTYPERTIDQNSNNHYYYDKKKKEWVKQVAMD